MEKQIIVKSNELSTVGSDWTSEDIKRLREQYAKEATDGEFKDFMYITKHCGLDPFRKQIYFQKYAGKPAYITSIDGYRLIASRTGLHLGTSDAKFEIDEVTKKPVSATIAVRRLVSGMTGEFIATARFDEYYPKNKQYKGLWDTMPRTMLAKCAEALALRKAFPNEIGGTYTKEEMQQAKMDEHEPPRKPAPKDVTPKKDPMPDLPMWTNEDSEPSIEDYVFKVATPFVGKKMSDFKNDELQKYALFVVTAATNSKRSITGPLYDDISAIQQALNLNEEMK